MASKIVTLSVTGMTIGDNINTVVKALEQVRGVCIVNAGQHATVTAQVTRTTEATALIETINKAGFGAYER